MLGSCADSEMNDFSGDMEGEQSQSFMLVSVSTGDGSFSRSGDDEFDPGSDWESRIDDLAFYFFREDGSPFVMTGLSTHSDSN
ncbi:MAG: hypothetical protein K2O49_03260, partial [Muribaculaceae bacterium]|nr:hypothetical protein [Muribaculaceae bacterium]